MYLLKLYHPLTPTGIIHNRQYISSTEAWLDAQEIMRQPFFKFETKDAPDPGIFYINTREITGVKIYQLDQTSQAS